MTGEEGKEWNSSLWAWTGWQYSWPNYWYIDIRQWLTSCI